MKFGITNARVARWALVCAMAVVGALVGGASLADTVKLKDGRTIEGEVTQRDAETYEIATRFGTVVVPAEEVISIEAGVTRDQLFAAQVDAAHMDDPLSIDQLAAWCEQNGFRTEAKAFTRQARMLRIEQRLAALAPRDAEGLYEVAMWAQAESYEAEIVDGLLGQALLANPEHQRARVATELRRLEAEAKQDRLAAKAARFEGEAFMQEATVARTEAQAEQRRAKELREQLEEQERTIQARLERARRSEEEAEAAAKRARQAERDAEAYRAQAQAEWNAARAASAQAQAQAQARARNTPCCCGRHH
ncbi:MAG: hypothetical protein ACYTFT_03640 [Planctomycetota bacterium]|jgi:hypothetical protein